MTTDKSPPSLEAAVTNFVGALSSPQHGAAGTALADLINTIDRLTGADLGAAAAQFMGGIDIGVATHANAAQVPPAQQPASAAQGDSLGAEIDYLAQTISARVGDDPKSSYTSSLIAAGVDKCAKKLGEEAVETAIAASKGDKAAIAAEAGDLLYHLLVLLQASGVSGDSVAAALKSRRGVSGLTEKASRPKS